MVQLECPSPNYSNSEYTLAASPWPGSVSSEGRAERHRPPVRPQLPIIGVQGILSLHFYSTTNTCCTVSLAPPSSESTAIGPRPRRSSGARFHGLRGEWRGADEGGSGACTVVKHSSTCKCKTQRYLCCAGGAYGFSLGRGVRRERGKRRARPKHSSVPSRGACRTASGIQFISSCDSRARADPF